MTSRSCPGGASTTGAPPSRRWTSTRCWPVGPQVALVDELAHTNVPGCRNDKRWQDVEELLAAGIDVISTVNIQHLESVNDVVEEITGIQQLETVPDEVVRAADQIELVDMAPEALRRRMAHGNIYGRRQGRRRPGQLLPGRQPLGAARAGPALDRRPGRRGAAATTARPTASTGRGRPGSASSSPSPARRAARTSSAGRPGWPPAPTPSWSASTSGPTPGSTRPTTGLDEHRRLLADLGGVYHEVVGSDPAESLVRFALAENATQLVLGATSRPRWREVLSGGSVINRVIRGAGPIDVHVISGDEAPGGDGERLLPPRRRRPTALPPGRQAAGWVMCAVGIPLLTLLLLAVEQHLNLPSEMLLYLLFVGAVAVVGGLWPALVAAVATSLIVNWFFTPPVHTWTIAETDNVVALVVFLLVAAMVVPAREPALAPLGRRGAGARRGRGDRRGRRQPGRRRATPSRWRSGTCARPSASTRSRCCDPTATATWSRPARASRCRRAPRAT